MAMDGSIFSQSSYSNNKHPIFNHSALGFSYENGRIDVSVHPFTGGSHPTDVRITTRYSDYWSESISGTVHEVSFGVLGWEVVVDGRAWKWMCDRVCRVGVLDFVNE